MKDELLRMRLTVLLEKTAGANFDALPGWWGNDPAGECRILDDLASGRENWRRAHRRAQSGLEALSRGDLDEAESFAWAANDHYLAALEARIYPSDVRELNSTAGRRGRPKSPEQQPNRPVRPRGRPRKK
jgi:hypothetical protein